MSKRVTIESIEVVEDKLGKTQPLICVEACDYEEQLMNDWRDYQDFRQDTMLIHINPTVQAELAPFIRAIKILNPKAENVKDNLKLLVGHEFNIGWDPERKKWYFWNMVH